jgi:hypothetical protein
VNDETIWELYENMHPVQHRVALMGTGYRRHVHPGPWDMRLRRYMNQEKAREAGATKRVEHARRRRLYSERLRRDRRRVRKGRAPILRSSAFQVLIPRAQLDVRNPGPEYLGMEVVLSAMVPDNQVYVVDPSMLDQFVEPYELQPPKFFDHDADAWKRELLYGLRAVRPPIHRATNFLIQADTPRRAFQGYTPSQVWVDDVEVDIDTWLNEGGTDRG